MTPAPKVSVIVPAFNASATIAEALRSVLSQTLTMLEVVVCDDASTDDTTAIVETFSGDGRVRLVGNAQRSGPGASRDRAIEAARGDWIAVLDADDAFHPARLERLLAAIDSASRDIMVFDDILECRHTDHGLAPWRRLRGAGAYGATTDPVTVPLDRWIASERLLIKPLFSRELVQRSGLRHSTRGYAEDTEFFLALAVAGARLRYVPEALYHYRKTPGSASASLSRHREMLDVLESARSALADTPEAVRALDARIAHEMHMDAYFDLLRHLKRADLAGAARIARSRPGVLKELLTRSIRELPYHLRLARDHTTSRTSS